MKIIEKKTLKKHQANHFLSFTNVNCDDYRSEKAQVIQKNGKDFSFTVGSYIVKSMIGSIDPDLDEID